MGDRLPGGLRPDLHRDPARRRGAPLPADGLMSTRDLATRAGSLLLVAGLLALGGWVRQTVTPQMDAPQSLGSEDQERLEHVASASLLGELRGSFADYLWMKADRLIHNGVEMRALTASEL